MVQERWPWHMGDGEAQGRKRERSERQTDAESFARRGKNGKIRCEQAREGWGRKMSRLALRSGHFPEALFDQFGQGLHGCFAVLAAGAQCECRTVSGPQRQQVEDAFAVNHLVAFDNFHLASERPRQFYEQMSRPGMESLRIYDGHRAYGDGVQRVEGDIGI